MSRQNNSWNKKIKKKLRQIAFLAVLNFFPVQNFIFGHFWNSQKLNLVKKRIHEIDLFDFTSFFGLDFFKFSGPLLLDQTEKISTWKDLLRLEIS